MVNFQTVLIENDESFEFLLPRINSAGAIAIDIETSNWWNQDEERISIIQVGFRERSGIVVAICDPLAKLDPECLRGVLELGMQTKVMHNAAYDAVRLARHYGIRTSPVYDTMLAARRGGEKSCSLKSLVERHLGITIDKSEQRGDWSRRPLSNLQLDYAALDAALTLLLYEQQIAHGMPNGDYQLKVGTPSQLRTQPLPSRLQATAAVDSFTSLTPLGEAIVSIISRFPARFTVHQLTSSISASRSGVVGWVIDERLGTDISLDQSAVLDEIEYLLQKKVVKIEAGGRLLL